MQSTRKEVAAKAVSHMLQQHLPDLLPEESNANAYSLTLLQQGWYNLALKAERTRDDAYVIRLRPLRGERGPLPYEKEVFILRELQGKLPVPSLPKRCSGYIHLGNVIGDCAFLIQRHIPHTPSAATRNKEKTKRQLATLARKIHSITLSGFGNSLSDAGGSMKNSSWEKEVHQLLQDLSTTTLMRDSFFPSSLIINSLKIVEELASYEAKPTLYHLDFLSNWSNVLFSEAGEIVGIIDWENAGTGMGFEREMSSYIYCQIRNGMERDDIATDLESFLTAYGMSQETFYQQHFQPIRAFLVREALLALLKYQVRKNDGTLFKEPWRKGFARKALCILRWAQTGELEERLQKVA